MGKNIVTILIVDAEKTLYHSIKELMGDEYLIISAKSGREAVSLTKRINPDLILADLNLPDIDSLSLCEKINEINSIKDIPLIFIADYANQDKGIECLNLGAIDLIYKSFSIELIVRKIKNYLSLFNYKNEALKLNQTIEQSPETILITDTSGEIEYVNPGFIELTGYKPEEIIGRNPRVLKSGYHTDDFYTDLWETVSSGEKWHGEIYNRKKDGEFFWEETSISPIKNWKDETVKYIAIKHDITEKKKAQKELKSTKNMLDKILNLSTEAIRYVDLNYNVIKTNEKYKLLSESYKNREGFKKNDLKCYEVFCTENCNTEDCSIKKILENGQTIQEDIKVKFNNKTKYFIVTVVPYKNEAGEIIGMIQSFRDITQRKEDENKLKEYNQEIESLYNKLNKEFKKGIKLHEHFLPKKLPEIDNFKYEVYFQPAERLGGDFYNAIKIGNYLLIYLADVSGHGLDGSMLNIFLRETINNYISSKLNNNIDLSPDALLKHIINRYHQEEFSRDYMVCLLIGLLNIEEREFSFINAGIQVPPVIIREDGTLRKLQNSGAPISTAIDIKFYNQTLNHKLENFKILSGDKLFLTTDGLVEETSKDINNKIPEMYGEKRLDKVLKNSCHLKPIEIIKKIKKDFKDYTGNEIGSDDITYMIISGE